MKSVVCITLAMTLCPVVVATLSAQSAVDSHQIMYTGDWPQKSGFRFLQIGDTQNPKKKEPQNDTQRAAIFQEMISQLRRDGEPADFILHSGDFVDHGGDGEEWRKYFDELFWQHLDDHEKRRFFPTLGNHEYKPHFLGFLGSGNGNLKHYFARFGHLDGKKYYYFVYGNSFFVVMDSGNNGIGKVFGGEKWERDFKGQRRWLQRAVLPAIEQNSDIENIFVIYHKCAYPTPVFRRNKNSAEILAIFETFNADLGNQYRVIALVGHIHTFSHMIVDFNGDGQAGVQQFCCGCGGGTQRGMKYYKKVETVADLDLYRKQKYQLLAGNGKTDDAAFDTVRFDNDIFGYLEVLVSDDLIFRFHRYQSDSKTFEVDYSYHLD